ncbi:MAG: D-alanine--D-alanine ligase [Opitutae bacterium]|nr:D-alanine--D-alanine ligase [Opitutae bacterium]
MTKINLPSITVLSGGVGEEREVSLETGQAISSALRDRFVVCLIDLNQTALPPDLDGSDTVVFPAIHGTFGEDGTLQRLLDERGVEYAGSSSISSELCMEKHLAKNRVWEAGVRVAPGRFFRDLNEVSASEVIATLGNDLIIKPTDQGSSVRLRVVKSEHELQVLLPELPNGNWLIEKRIRGRELTVGVLRGNPLGVVEVIPLGGIYDYERKYQSGQTEYRYPAVLPCEVEKEVKMAAQTAFEVCGCRDFARVDFIVCEDGHSHFLEVNTLPGLTETSLLPKSASCAGYDFGHLANELIEPAIDRFTHRRDSY